MTSIEKNSKVILSLRQLEMRFPLPATAGEQLKSLFKGCLTSKSVLAVSEVHLDIYAGEVVGVVGESGCGKSTLGRMVAGILAPTHGEISYKDQIISRMDVAARRQYELSVQMIFQDPFSSLNPRMRVLDIIGEAPIVHGLIRRGEKDAYISNLMKKVGLDPAYRFRYPHQFSGGQRQRIGIARALALKPSVIVCDEAVAALDVSIQAQVLNLFIQLRKEFDLTYFFISHNLGVVSHISDRVIVMYLGRIVELASTDKIFTSANHPYTQALIRELPQLRSDQRQFEPIKGELPSPIDPPSGCAFHPRCPYVMPRCRVERPLLTNVADHHDDTGNVALHHWSACHLNDKGQHPDRA